MAQLLRVNAGHYKDGGIPGKTQLNISMEGGVKECTRRAAYMVVRALALQTKATQTASSSYIFSAVIFTMSLNLSGPQVPHS
jgi:hypothetical protein